MLFKQYGIRNSSNIKLDSVTVANRTMSGIRQPKLLTDIRNRKSVLGPLIIEDLRS